MNLEVRNTFHVKWPKSCETSYQTFLHEYGNYDSMRPFAEVDLGKNPDYYHYFTRQTVRHWLTMKPYSHIDKT